jgi:CBS domain-containing protein
MKVIEMLQRGAILAPLDAPDLEWALTAALRTISTVSDDVATKLAADVVAGVSGEVYGVHERVVVALAESHAVEDICAVIAVVPAGFSPDDPEVGADNGGDAPVVATEADASLTSRVDPHSEALLVLVTPGRFISLRDQMLPALKRFFREAERVAPLLNARSVDEVEGVRGLMDLELHQSLLVEDVVEPVQYRVYPDTPYSEVADLMVRRGLQSVPVVGEDYEFLGVITTGDALEEVLSHAQVEESAGGSPPTPQEEPTAREIMTRTVMCISEEQSLLEAASIMVNRDVEQLPVIREGEMIGFLTRGEVLRWLFPDTSFKQEK